MLYYIILYMPNQWGFKIAKIHSQGVQALARSKCSSPGLQPGNHSLFGPGRPGRPKSGQQIGKQGVWYLKMWENGPSTLLSDGLRPRFL